MMNIKKLATQKNNLIRLIKSSRGAVSPFMFGMLMAISIFSTMAARYALQDLRDIEQQRLDHQKQSAQDIRKALELSILTETNATYSNSFDLDRAKAYTTFSDGKTRGGSDALLNIKNGSDTLGITGKRALITTSDDVFVQDDVSATITADGLSSLQVGSNQAVELLDTNKIRQHQVKQSKDNMQALVAQIYKFYAEKQSGNIHRFPDSSEFATIESMLRATDVWGNSFTYIVAGDSQSATLSFTTPWGYTHTESLSIR